jgi:hypothetical protein
MVIVLCRFHIVVDGSSYRIKQNYILRHADNLKKVPSDDVIVLSPFYAFFRHILFTSILHISFVQVSIAHFFQWMFLVAKIRKVLNIVR